MSVETLQELAVKIFFEEDQASKASVTAGLKALAGFAVGSQVTGFLKELAYGAIEAGAQMDDFANRLGVGTEELQGFMYAASLSGASSQEAANGIRVLSAQIEAAVGGSKEAVSAFADLGVAFKDSEGNARAPLEIFNEVAQGFEKLADGPEKTAKAMKLLGRAGLTLVPLLNEGPEGIRKLTDEAERLGVIVSKDTIKTLAEADDAFDALRQQTNALKMNIGAALAPVLMRVTAFFREKLLPTITKLIRETNILKYATGLLVGSLVPIFTGAFVKAAQFFGVLKQGNVSILDMVRGFMKFGPIVLLIAGIALAIEDLYTWLTGGDSLIGRFLEKFLGAKEAADLANTLKEAFAGIWVALSGLGPVLAGAVASLATLAVNVAPVLAKGLQFVLNLLTSLIAAVDLLVVGWKSLLGMGDKGELWKQREGALATLKKGLLGAGNVLVEAVNGKPALPTPPPAGGAAIGPGLDQTNNVTINVADANGVAGAVKGAIGDANQAAFAAAGG
jgi:hypothetical protein